MPFVRIDLRKGKTTDYRQKVADVVYEALMSVGVPEKDRFQVINEYDTDGLIYDASYLGINRSDDFIAIQITWNEGRNTEQKKVLYSAIAEGMNKAVGLRKEDVFISLIEVKKENWSFGNGEAQYAS